MYALYWCWEIVVDCKVWQIKWWRIDESSLYVRIYVHILRLNVGVILCPFCHCRDFICIFIIVHRDFYQK